MAKTTIDFIMGKGGVGRTTVARALAHQYVAKGEPTILVECNGCADIPILYNKTSTGYTELELQPALWTISVSPMAAIEEYVVQQLKMRKLYRLIFENRLVSPLIEAAPGLHDAVQLGKVYDLYISNRWKHIIVDCPATGHGISLIAAAQTMMELSRRGPLYKQSQLVEDVVSEHGRVLFVCLPEELPSRETLQLWKTMRADWHDKVLGVIINQWTPMSETLEKAFQGSTPNPSLEAHPEYQTVFGLLQEQYQQQKIWHAWLQRQLCEPHALPLLTYNKWIDQPTRSCVPPIHDLGARL